jgi:alanyl-tRNA synthetase
MTKRLYLDDSYQTDFVATLTHAAPCKEGVRVTLDQTCFYPEGGGQPCDLGRIGTTNVLDVQISDGTITHTTDAEPMGPELSCRVDWTRRYDHMQQHTGQHLLTRCFLKSVDANTVGFTLGADYSYIELDRESISAAERLEAEEMANCLISEALPVNVRWIEREQLDALGIRARGLPETVRHVRVIEIAGFDRTACGGTHLKNTAEIGPLRITGIERIRGHQRVFFLCGSRAHDDHRKKAAILDRVCRELTTRMDELPEVIKGKISEIKGLAKEIQTLRVELAKHLAASLIQGAETRGDIRLVTHVVEGWGMNEITALANEVVSRGKAVALIGSRADKASVAFGSSPDSGVDVSKLLSASIKAVGGRGGGKSMLARGGCPDPSRLDELLKKARETFFGL